MTDLSEAKELAPKFWGLVDFDSQDDCDAALFSPWVWGLVATPNRNAGGLSHFPHTRGGWSGNHFEPSVLAIIFPTIMGVGPVPPALCRG
jgi:hypothetical protein